MCRWRKHCFNKFKSTIKTDALVFRWFLYLISQKKVKKDLSAHNSTYKRLKNAIFYRNVCSFVLWMALLYMLITEQYAVLCVIVPIGLVYLKLRQIINEYVSTLSLDLIKKHFKSDDVGHQTLYQISEYLANQYHIRSLVMSMTSVDAIVRTTLLFALIFAFCIFPLNFLPFWGAILIVYCATCTLINLPFIYARLS